VKLVAVALLLALAGCGGGGPGPGNAATAPGPAPVQRMDAPLPDMNTEAAHAPPERFIVCPGDPRCPPEGSQPKGRQPN